VLVASPHRSHDSNYGIGGGGARSTTTPAHATRALVYGILEAITTELKIDRRRRYGWNVDGLLRPRELSGKLGTSCAKLEELTTRSQ